MSTPGEITDQGSGPQSSGERPGPAPVDPPRRILVIGGAGFVGRAVVQELLRHSAEVTVLDVRAPDGLPIQFKSGSILDEHALDAAVEGHDAVLHLAAMLGVEACQRFPAELIQTNLGGTANVLRACARHGVTRLLFSSSSEIYGDGAADVFRETDRPTPKSLYGRTKVLGEAMIQAFATRSNLTATVVRLFNVYGPGQRSDFVVPTFIDLALRGIPLTVHGDGSQIRTFTHVSDAARGMVCALMNSERPFDIFNIGSQEVSTIERLAHQVKLLTGSQSPVNKIPFGKREAAGRNPSYEIYRRIPDVEKARRLLGFTASVTLAEGVLSVVPERRAQLERISQVHAA